jgi:hypothetical protein
MEKRFISFDWDNMNEAHSCQACTPVSDKIVTNHANGIRVTQTKKIFHGFFKSTSIWFWWNIAIVANVPPKPNRRGFEKAMKNFLGLSDPNAVCMIGDNFITDGGARLAGMRFIHIIPVKGNEPFFHAFTRKLAFLCARFYFPRSFS